MIPIIYGPDEQTFTSEGLGRVRDIISGSVKEKLNGLCELNATVPVDGQDADLLTESSFVFAKASDKDLTGQPFRIYRTNQKAKDKKIQIYARHWLYDASGIPVGPFTAVGVVPALTGLVSNSLEEHPFKVWTDIANTETTYSQAVPLSFRQCLGGVAGSILDRFGGEYEWAMDTVKLHAHRGSDTGVYIQYKKNLTAFEIDRNNEAAAYTGCLAFYKTDDAVVTGTVQKISNPEDFPAQKIFILDCTSDFDEAPTVEQLNAMAAAYMTANGFGIPYKDNLKVSFAPLWKTEEYKNVAALERIGLGDYVHVVYKQYDLVMQVIETDYDFVNERYNSITLGTKKASLSSKVAEIAKGTQGDVINEAKSMMEAELDHAADVLSGGTGGCIYTSRNADGMPNELYIMDQPDTGTAVNVLRINYMGIAFSQSGINGPYTTAWTIDSHFVADFITAGELSGNLIRAGSILASALEVAVQTIVQGIKMNFSFLNDGLHIAQKDESGNIIGAYQTLVSDLGLRVLETASGNSFLIAEGDTVTANNLTADQYLRVRSENVASRFQQFYSTAHSEYEFGLFWEIV